MVELVDSGDLGSPVERRAGSSPVTRTMIAISFDYAKDIAILFAATFVSSKIHKICLLNIDFIAQSDTILLRESKQHQQREKRPL